jgi:general secretion pathway protein F
VTAHDARLTFAWRAVGSDGRVQRGRIDAPSRDAALARLSEQGLHPVAVTDDHQVGARRSALPMADAALGLRILADLLDSGMPLRRALATLETLVSPRWKAALPDVRQAVREGRTLSRALAESAVGLPDLALGVIHAGERGSGLAAAVRHAAELCHEAATTRAAFRAALAYPILLVTAGSAVVALLVGVVLPKFVAILGDLGQALPPSTRLVLAAGSFLRTGALPMLVVAAVGAALWNAWVRTAQGRRRWHAMLLGFPIVGDVRLSSASARLCAALSALLANGVAIAPALLHAAAAAGDAEVRERVLAARVAVEQGARLSRALEDHRAATALVQRLVRAGEESGNVTPMLSHAARMERDRATQRVRGAVQLLEPLLIIGFGGIVALVAAGLLQALYSVRPGA